MGHGGIGGACRLCERIGADQRHVAKAGSLRCARDDEVGATSKYRTLKAAAHFPGSGPKTFLGPRSYTIALLANPGTRGSGCALRAIPSGHGEMLC